MVADILIHKNLNKGFKKVVNINIWNTYSYIWNLCTQIIVISLPVLQFEWIFETVIVL